MICVQIIKFIGCLYINVMHKMFKTLLLSRSNDWNRNGQYNGQTILINKVHSAREEAYFDIIELVCPKYVGNQKIIIFLTPLMTEIEMVSLVVKWPWPTRSTVHVTKLILFSLNLTTQKTWKTK